MSGEVRVGAATEAPTPGISIVIRSSNRPSLVAALASIAMQDHPALEVVVVAASGAAHPAPAQRTGVHAVRFVASDGALSRPQAANAGLDAARGDWITFLDDDDVLLRGHISTLVAARRDAGGAKLVYSSARARFSDGSEQPLGQPFALAQLYERNFIHLSMSLFSRELVSAGCRFDESLHILQDWDFFLQCAQHTRFHFVPAATFEWRADIGTSGAGGGANQDDARFAAYRDRIYAKWADRRDALVDRVRAALQDAVARAQRGDLAGAEAGCLAVLAYSQNDPYALNVLAMVRRTAGRLGEAREAQELACAVRPDDAPLVYNLALLCRMQGDVAGALACCRRALRRAPGFAPAQKLNAELQAAGGG